METAADHGLRPEAITLAQNDAEQRHRETSPGHKHAGDVPHDRGLLRFGSNHKAGRVAQRHDRNVKGIAKLHETCGLVARRRIDRATEMLRIVGDQPEWLALDANEGGDDPDTEIPAYFEHRSLVGQQIDDVAHVIDAQPVFRNSTPQQALVPCIPGGQRALKIREIFLRRTCGFRFVLNENVDDAVRCLE